MNRSAIDITRLEILASGRLWKAVEDKPFAFDWFFIMRWLDGAHPQLPRLGHAVHPSQEPVRIGQRPTLGFAAATLAGVDSGDTTSHGKPRLYQYAFGLFGPNGPLPTHLSELAHERNHNQHDTTLTGFLDIFHHRASLLFYRAWSDAQSVTSLDRPDGGNFSRYVDSLIGYRSTHTPQTNRIDIQAKRRQAGNLVRHVRNAEGLESILSRYFNAPARIEEWQFGWLAIAPRERTRLGAPGPEHRFNTLGSGAVIGARVPSRQHAFRVTIGPLDFAGYQRFLPVGLHFLSVRDWIRDYVGYEFAWDFRLVLRRDSIPVVQLGSAAARLGWSTWLGQRPVTAGDADDLVLNPERTSHGPGHISHHDTP